MTVKELIEALSKVPDDSYVVEANYTDSWYSEHAEVTEVITDEENGTVTIIYG